MLTRLAPLTPVNNPALDGLVAITVRPDTIGFYSRHSISYRERYYLAKLLGVPVADVFIGDNKRWGSEVRVSRLGSRDQLAKLQGWARSKNRIFFSWLHIAFDLQFSSHEAWHAAFELLKVHLVILNGARGARPMTYGSTRYAVEFASPDRPPKLQGKKTTRNFAMYPKGDTTLRLELRLFSAATIKKNRFTSVATIMDDCDAPEWLFHKHFRLQLLSDTYIRKEVKEEAERSKSLKRKRRVDPAGHGRTVKAIIERRIHLHPQNARHACSLKPLDLGGVPIEWVERQAQFTL